MQYLAKTFKKWTTLPVHSPPLGLPPSSADLSATLCCRQRLHSWNMTTFYHWMSEQYKRFLHWHFTLLSMHWVISTGSVHLFYFNATRTERFTKLFETLIIKQWYISRFDYYVMNQTSFIKYVSIWHNRCVISR